MEDKCFVFEESLIESAQDTMKKLINKQYYIPAIKTGLPYLLIAISLSKDDLGRRSLELCYLRNTTEGEGRKI